MVLVENKKIEMSVKDISRVVNKNERTIQRWIENIITNDKMSLANDKMSEDEYIRLKEDVLSIKNKIHKSSPNYPTKFNLPETILIIEEGLGKNAALIFGENAKHVDSKIDNEKLNDKIFKLIIDMIPRIVSETVKQLKPMIQESNRQLPILPEINKRNKINNLVKKISNIQNIDIHTSWNNLYDEYYCRYNISLKRQTNYYNVKNNINISIIEYSDIIGAIDDLILVAEYILKENI